MLIGSNFIQVLPLSLNPFNQLVAGQGPAVNIFSQSQPGNSPFVFAQANVSSNNFFNGSQGQNNGIELLLNLDVTEGLNPPPLNEDFQTIQTSSNLENSEEIEEKAENSAENDRELLENSERRLRNIERQEVELTRIFSTFLRRMTDLTSGINLSIFETETFGKLAGLHEMIAFSQGRKVNLAMSESFTINQDLTSRVTEFEQMSRRANQSQNAFLASSLDQMQIDVTTDNNSDLGIQQFLQTNAHNLQSNALTRQLDAENNRSQQFFLSLGKTYEFYAVLQQQLSAILSVTNYFEDFEGAS